MQTTPHPTRARRVSPARPGDVTATHSTPKKQTASKRGRTLDDEKADLLLAINLVIGEAPEAEVRFHPTRRWRFDLAWRSTKLAVELEGGTFVRGRHTSGKGFQDDCTKYNAAAIMGWCVLRFTRAMVASGEALETILAAYRLRSEEAGLVA